MLVATIVLSITGCMDRRQGATASRHPKDTLYTEQRAIEAYDYQPERALQMVDSAVAVGDMSLWRGKMLRARIYSSTLAPERLDSIMHWREGARLDSAKAIGERLLEDDSVRTDLARQQDVLETLAYTARMQNDTLGWLQRSRELVEVCHGQGAETEALRNEAEVGAALCFLGKETEGMARIDSVIALLDVKKFNELDAMLIVLKRKVCVLAERGRYAEMLPPARQMLERLSDYEQHPDRYHDGSYREPKDSTDRQDYIEFYRSKAQKYIAAAYAAIGESGNMEESFRQLETIVRDAAAREHRARYQAIEQQYETERQRAEARRNALIAWSTGIISLLAVCFALFALYKHRETQRKNRALVRQIDEAMAYKERYEALLSPKTFDAPKSENAEEYADTDLFAQIHDTIVREQLYLNPACDRQMLCERFGLKKEQIGTAFAAKGEYKLPSGGVMQGRNVSAYINRLRLEYASHLLSEQPSMDIRRVAEASGFSSHKYFSTCFKQFFGLSPSEFRQAKSV